MATGGIASINFQAQALQLQAERGRVLASNIANADTPNYKARDFNFQQALAQATGAAVAAPQIARTNAAHIAGTGAGAGPMSPPLLYRAPVQSAVDGNTVDLDVERAGFAENSLRYQATLTFLNGQIKQMMTAINGQ